MAGKFEGLTDEQWECIRYFLPAEPEKRGQGMPHAPFSPHIQHHCIGRHYRLSLVRHSNWRTVR